MMAFLFVLTQKETKKSRLYIHRLRTTLHFTTSPQLANVINGFFYKESDGCAQTGVWLRSIPLVLLHNGRNATNMKALNPTKIHGNKPTFQYPD